MLPNCRPRVLTLLGSVAIAFTMVAFVAIALPSAQAPGQKPASAAGLPSETPSRFEPPTADFDHVRRDVMIPMRDGVRLHTIILVPKGAVRAPILLTRTPYDAKALTTHAPSAHLGPALWGYDNATEVIVEGGYIRAVQDVRGKYGSEGDYVMNRPLRGPLNPTQVDHATDTYDTIDWLVKNIPESNGKVGILGISYDGFLPLMALVNPHPALKVSVPMNPMVDGWMGDDWYHYGAFRQANLAYIFEQDGTRASDLKWWDTHFDEYDMYMQAGSAGELARRRGMDQLGFWQKLVAHPAYDAFWQSQAMDRVLAAQPLARARDAGAQPVGPGGHLRRHRRLQGHQAEGHRQRQGLPGDGPVVPRPVDWRREFTGRSQVRQRHLSLLPAAHPPPVPRPVPEGRRAKGRPAARRRLRDGHERVAAPAGVAGRVREGLLHPGQAALPGRGLQGGIRRAESRRQRVPTSTSPIPRSR